MSSRLRKAAGFWLLASLFMAAVLAAFAFQDGQAASSQQPTPTFIPNPRLAEPTLPVDPSQADLGSQDFWLYCMVCHGDYGQGLTEEFRQLYPPEEQNCWQSGCHGTRPYENGFTLPTTVPAVIGAEAKLAKFATAADLFAFIRAAMPWHSPGTLTEEEYWRLAAFLLRENGYENHFSTLGPDNATSILLGGQTVLPTDPQPAPSDGQSIVSPHIANDERWVISALAAGTFLVLVLVVIFLRRRTK